jgi:hypothetical protein
MRTKLLPIEVKSTTRPAGMTRKRSESAVPTSRGRVFMP